MAGGRGPRPPRAGPRLVPTEGMPTPPKTITPRRTLLTIPLVATACRPTSPANTAASVHKPDRQVETPAARRSVSALEPTVRPRDRTSLSSFVSIAEAPGLPLGVPGKRSVPEHIGQPQALRLPPVQDRFHDVGRQAGEREETADVGVRHALMLRESVTDFAQPLSIRRHQRRARASTLTSVSSRRGFDAGAAAPSGVMISFRPPRRCSRIGIGYRGAGLDARSLVSRLHTLPRPSSGAAPYSSASSATMLRVSGGAPRSIVR